MESLTWLLIRCLSGALLGILPGLAIAALGAQQQGIGIAIIGGTLGVGLALSKPLYQRSAGKSLAKGAALFAKITLDRNLPGAGQLVQVEDELIAGDEPTDPSHYERLEQRMIWSGLFTLAVIAILGIGAVFCLQLDDQVEKPAWQARLEWLLIVVITAPVAGFFLGAPLGALTIPGIHRRDIVLGLIFGLLVGLGLATAVAPGAKIPESNVYVIFCGGAGALGMFCGLLSGAARQPMFDAGEDDSAG